MVAPILNRPMRPTTAHKPAGPTAGDFKKASKGLYDAAWDKNGFKNIKAPSAAALAGARTIDMTADGSDGVQELKLAKNGDVYVTARAPGRPDQWLQIKPAFIRKFFERELAKDQVSVKKPVSKPLSYPHFDVTPPGTDGVATLYNIKGQSYVTYRTPSMPETWYRLDAKKPSATWLPK